MLSDEEREKLEREFQYALDNIVSKIKGETATAIVCSEQSMILLFEKLMLKIEKQSKEIEEYKKQLDLDYVDKHFVPVERYNQLEKEIEELNKSDASKEQSSMDYYNLYKELVDKIKAKIEEVEQWELYNMKIPRLSTLDERLGAKIGIKYVLQSLLEKE